MAGSTTAPSSSSLLRTASAPIASHRAVVGPCPYCGPPEAPCSHSVPVRGTPIAISAPPNSFTRLEALITTRDFLNRVIGALQADRGDAITSIDVVRDPGYSCSQACSSRPASPVTVQRLDTRDRPETPVLVRSYNPRRVNAPRQPSPDGMQLQR